MSTTVLPPTVAPTGGTATGATAPLPSGTGTVPALPPSLATALQSGGNLAAQVTAKPQPGQLTLTIAGETVQVQTPLPLPPGTSLAVALQNLGPPATLSLTPQQPGAQQVPVPGQGQGAATTTATTTGNVAPQPAVVTTLSQGSILTGTVITGGASIPAPQGTGQASQAPLTQQGAAGQQPTATQAATNAPPATQTAPAPLPPGTTLQLRLLGFAPQGQPLSGVGSAGSFTGVVTGQSTASSATVQTPLGTVSVTLPNAPPAGTQLLLSTVGTPQLPLTGSAAAEAGGARFQALQDALSLIQRSDPAAAQRITQSLIPQPNGQFGLAAAFLTNAIRQGNIEKWLGNDGVNALKKGEGGGALSRLQGEMGRAQGRAHDGAGQDWRVTTLPFMNEGKVEEIRLYTKDRPDEDGGDGSQDGKKEAKRFVIEADFTRLGPIQLDGFSQDRTIDLRVRSQKPFAAEARDEIRALFADTISALGLSGRLEFSVVPAFDLVPDRPAERAGGLTV